MIEIVINRYLKNSITENLKSGLVLGIFGARRTGKTVLMNWIIKELDNKNLLFVNGDDLTVQEMLSSQRTEILSGFVSGKEYLFIDEAQKISNIGNSLKILIDKFKSLKIVVSGSSSLDLKNKIGEPLTGRSRFFNLYPISQIELGQDYLTAAQTLESKLIFGMYPQVITSNTNDDKKEILVSVKNGYLLRDVLELDNLKDSVFILNLLRLIALQIGKNISYNEIAGSLKVNSRTVMRYLDILEKSYILFSLRGFSRNLRNEYSKTPRYYFWDNGIRNAIINNYNNLVNRDDIGMLWENFVISERIKKGNYMRHFRDYYFWRTYTQKEIDLIEEKDGIINGFEIKWKKAKGKKPVEFLNAYKNSTYEIINNENYLPFIT